MSFSKFSTPQTASSNDKPDDKTKAAPPVAAPEVQPEKKQDDVVPTQKS